MVELRHTHLELFFLSSQELSWIYGTRSVGLATYRAEGALTFECQRRTYGTMDFLLFEVTVILRDFRKCLDFP